MALAWIVASPLAGRAQSGAAAGEWPFYAGDAGSTKYSPLAQIDETNVRELEIVWRWVSPDNAISGPQNAVFESTPLMVDGVLYTSTSFSQAAAVDAGTGKTLWVYDPQSYRSGRPPNNGFLHRGVAYWSDGEDRRVLLATGDGRLISLVADTGKPDPGFGHNGIVDLKDGISRLTGSSVEYGATSPPMVVGDVLVMGSSVHDGIVGPEGPPGDVRGYDARTGRRLWTFHTVAQPGEAGNETWEAGSWEYTGGANVWAPMSADLELGYVYLPVSCPTNNYNGGRRLGDNLFANSLVCLDARTGERVWHFQIVHHDIWDYDLPAAPNLVDLTVRGRKVKAVAQVTKHGFTFVFDRVTGEPVWPINEVPVPPSTVPGERTSPTQPFPTRPPPFTRQGVSVQELIDFNPQLRAQAEAILDNYDWGPLFTPPSLRGAILFPGIGGGAAWGGASFDPTTRTLYVSTLGAVPYLIRLAPGGLPGFHVPSTVEILSGPQGLPLFKPPWGQITAIDLDRGEILWQRPNDDTATGRAGHTSSLLTRTLLFSYNRNETVLRAFDKSNGDHLWAMDLPARGGGAPMTYLHEDRQYVVVAVGIGNQTTELVAFALPKPVGPGTVQFATTGARVGEAEASATVVVTRTGGSEGAASVEVRSVGGTATPGEDYAAVAQTVGWLDGDAEPRPVAVTLLDDELEEPDETVVLRLENLNGGLEPGATPQTTLTLVDDDTGPCVKDPQTLCLNNGRFRVRGSFQAPGGDPGQGQVVELTRDSGYMTFFNPANVELVVKVIDACETTSRRFWVFAAGLTNVEVTLTVDDTLSNESRTYTNPGGTRFQPILDTAAFSTCP